MLLAAIGLGGLGKIVTFLVMLSVLVVLHEYGHFLVARRNRVRVNEFSVGMGPLLLKWVSPRSGTQYSLRALPLGGYCAMQGEDGKSNEAEQQREFRAGVSHEDDNFQAKTTWQRLAIVLAGPVANFILTWVLLLVGAVAFGVVTDEAKPVIGILVHGSPADLAGMHEGDRIVAIDGVPVASGKQLITTIHASLGKPLAVSYARDGATTTATMTPKACPAPANPKWGCIGFQPVPAYQRVGLGEAIVASGQEFVGVAEQTAESVSMLVLHFTKYANQTMGAIGMGQVAYTIQDWGWGPYFQLAALLSFALGVFNLLPIPALDGGRAVFIIAEMLRGKPVDPEKEAMVHFAGFAALIALMALRAIFDILRIVDGKGLM